MGGTDLKLRQAGGVGGQRTVRRDATVPTVGGCVTWAAPDGTTGSLERTHSADFVMIPPFGYCSGSESGASALRRYQERKLRLLSFWRDGIERQLAAIVVGEGLVDDQKPSLAASIGSIRIARAPTGTDPTGPPSQRSHLPLWGRSTSGGRGSGCAQAPLGRRR